MNTWITIYLLGFTGTLIYFNAVAHRKMQGLAKGNPLKVSLALLVTSVLWFITWVIVIGWLVLSRKETQS